MCFLPKSGCIILKDVQNPLAQNGDPPSMPQLGFVPAL